jgi:membrane protein YdbS with pleckstrin-like domain
MAIPTDAGTAGPPPVLLTFRTDARFYSAGALVLLAGAAGLVVAGVAIAPGWAFWGPALALAAAALWVWLRSLGRKAARYSVSAQRIEIERGLLSRRVENIDLWRVRDVVLDQSLIDRMRGTGTLTVYSTDQVEPVFGVGPVTEARFVFEKLRDAVAQARRDAGVVRVDR